MPTAGLVLLAMAIWGTTWIAIAFRTPAVAPEVGVALRFSVAATRLAAYCRLRGIRLRMPGGVHGWLALLGIPGFRLGGVFVYHGERLIVSGLIRGRRRGDAAGQHGLARLFFGTALSARVGLGGGPGLTGIALVFQPEFARLDGSAPQLAGAAPAAGPCC